MTKPLYSPTDPEPSTQIRCSQCGRTHYDENYTECVECGALL